MAKQQIIALAKKRWAKKSPSRKHRTVSAAKPPSLMRNWPASAADAVQESIIGCWNLSMRQINYEGMEGTAAIVTCRECGCVWTDGRYRWK